MYICHTFAHCRTQVLPIACCFLFRKSIRRILNHQRLVCAFISLCVCMNLQLYVCTLASLFHVRVLCVNVLVLNIRTFGIRNADKRNCSSQKNVCVCWFMSIFRDTRIRILCNRSEMLSMRITTLCIVCMNV